MTTNKKYQKKYKWETSSEDEKLKFSQEDIEALQDFSVSTHLRDDTLQKCMFDFFLDNLRKGNEYIPESKVIELYEYKDEEYYSRKREREISSRYNKKLMDNFKGPIHAINNTLAEYDNTKTYFIGRKGKKKGERLWKFVKHAEVNQKLKGDLMASPFKYLLTDKEQINIINFFKNLDEIEKDFDGTIKNLETIIEKWKEIKKYNLISIEKIEYDTFLCDIFTTKYAHKHPKFYLKLIEDYLNNQDILSDSSTILWLAFQISDIYNKYPQYISIIEKWINSPNTSFQVVSIKAYAKHLYKVDRDKSNEFLHKMYDSNQLSHEEIAWLFIEDFPIDKDWLPLIDKICYSENYEIRNTIGHALARSILLGDRDVFNYIKTKLKSSNTNVRESIAIAIGSSYELPKAWELLIKIHEDEEDNVKCRFAFEIVDQIWLGFVSIPSKINKQKLLSIIKRTYNNVGSESQKRIKAHIAKYKNEKYDYFSWFTNKKTYLKFMRIINELESNLS